MATQVSSIEECEPEFLKLLEIYNKQPDEYRDAIILLEKSLNNIRRAKECIKQTDYTGLSQNLTAEDYKRMQYELDAAAGIKIDQDYENINYRFNSSVLHQGGTKLKHIQEFQRCGFHMHKSNGGEFLPGKHEEIEDTLYDDLIGRKAESGVNFSDYDYRAFDAWGDYGREQSNELGIPDFESFLIKVINAAKVGSVSDVKVRAIATSDAMPCTRFEDWIRDDYVIAPVSGLKFDKDKKLFLPKLATASEIQADRAKRMDLEDELGRQVKFI